MMVLATYNQLANWILLPIIWAIQKQNKNTHILREVRWACIWSHTTSLLRVALMGRSTRTNRALALHKVNPDSNPGTAYSPQALPVPWAIPGVDQKGKKKIKTKKNCTEQGFPDSKISWVLKLIGLLKMTFLDYSSLNCRKPIFVLVQSKKDSHGLRAIIQGHNWEVHLDVHSCWGGGWRFGDQTQWCSEWLL